MQRHPEESFEDYKVRRAAANYAIKMINAQSRGGRQPNARAKRLGKGMYGRTLAAHFAKMDLAKLTRKS